MDLEGIMLSEISQSEKDKYHMISLICGIQWKNKQNRNTLINTDWQLSEGRGIGGLGEIGEGIKQNSPKKLIDKQQGGDSQRERGWGQVEGDKRGTSGDRRRLTLDGEHTIQCTDDVL